MALLGGSPRLVLLFSGKRKSGKDFVTDALQSRCNLGRGKGMRDGDHKVPGLEGWVGA